MCWDRRSQEATDVADIFAISESASHPRRAAAPHRLLGLRRQHIQRMDSIKRQRPAVTKVQFEASIGRTALEVIQVVSVIYPYCIQVVRTITMQRQNAGWVKRTDSGWQAASAGTFTFPTDVEGTIYGPRTSGRVERRL